MLRSSFKYCFEIAQARHASSKPPPLPFPIQRNPTPHEIFHLPRNASQSDVRARYLQLVRIYHPDTVSDPSISSAVAHARFQAITSAYNVLKDGSPEQAPNPTTPAARAMYKRRRNLYTGPQLADDSWKDKIIVAGVIFGAFCFAIQTAATRRAALVETIVVRPPNIQPNMQPSVEERLGQDG